MNSTLLNYIKTKEHEKALDLINEKYENSISEIYNKIIYLIIYSNEIKNYDAFKFFLIELEKIIYDNKKYVNVYIEDISSLIDRYNYDFDLLISVYEVSNLMREEIGYFLVLFKNDIDCYLPQYEFIKSELIERCKQDYTLASDVIMYLCDYDNMEPEIMEISKNDIYLTETIESCMKKNNNIYKNLIKNIENVDYIIQLNIDVNDYDTIKKIIDKVSNIYELIKNNTEDHKFLEIVNSKMTLDLDVLYDITNGDVNTLKIFLEKGNNATGAMIMAIEDENIKAQELLKSKADKKIFKQYLPQK